MFGRADRISRIFEKIVAGLYFHEYGDRLDVSDLTVHQVLERLPDDTHELIRTKVPLRQVGM